MSFKLKEYNPKVKLPNADLCLEDAESLYKILDNITPRISGNWEIFIINPTIKECKTLLDDKSVPQWVTVTIYIQPKKMEQVCLEFPEYRQKKVSFKEQAKEVLADVQHLVDKKAFNILVNVFRGNIGDFQKTILDLDANCKGNKITVKDVQSKVNYVRPVYASDVIDAFLLHENQRWALLNKLIQELGESYAYNAAYKYVKTLLQQKQDYLQNEDVELRAVKRIDAPSICYAYVLFSLSSSYKQLYGIFQALDNRSADYLERMSNVNLQ